MSGTAPADTVASPCQDICKLNSQQVCTGCGRTLAEIAAWSRASAEQRAQIVAAARLRQARRPALQSSGD